MLQPKRVKYRRPHSLKYEGKSKAGNEVSLVNSVSKLLREITLPLAKLKLPVLYYQDTQKEAVKFGFVYSHKWQKQRNLPKFVWVLVKVAQSHGLQLLKLAVSCLKLVELEKQMLVKHFAWQLTNYQLELVS